MQLISFDVGIHNMAYCIFEWNETEKEKLKVVDWKVISLINDEDSNISYKCNCVIQPKKKSGISLNTPDKICGNKALYKKNTHYYCLKHANTCEYIIPKKEYTAAHFKKMKKEDLVIYKVNHFIPIAENITTKPDIVNAIVSYYETKLLEPIDTKRANAGEANLINIGRNMKKRLDRIENMEEITHVIIENQISPIATRMKTIQGMLSQYFIMKCPETIIIEFISSLNKLKGFQGTAATQPQGEPGEENGTSNKSNNKATYKANKKDGVKICLDILEKSTITNQITSKNTSINLKEVLNKPKKDDYADAFLQGIWYLKNKNIFELSK